MGGFGFLLQNFGPMVETHECHLRVVVLLGRWWRHLNTTCCNGTHLNFLHWEVMGIVFTCPCPLVSTDMSFDTWLEKSFVSAFCSIVLGLWWRPMNAICCSVNVDGVVVGDGGDTLTPHVVMELI